MLRNTYTWLFLSFVGGLIAGGIIFHVLHPKTVPVKVDEGPPVGENSDTIRAMHQDFHRLLWRSYGLFLAAVTLIGGWFAKDLAFKEDLVAHIEACSFVSVILLGFIVAVSLLMMWAAYVSYSLWLLNWAIAELDRVYRWFLYQPRRIAFNSIFAPAVDVLFFVLCWAIILAYREPSPSCHDKSVLWNVFLHSTVAIFGIGVYIRFRSRQVVGVGVSARREPPQREEKG